MADDAAVRILSFNRGARSVDVSAPIFLAEGSLGCDAARARRSDRILPTVRQRLLPCPRPRRPRLPRKRKRRRETAARGWRRHPRDRSWCLRWRRHERTRRPAVLPPSRAPGTRPAQCDGGELLRHGRHTKCHPRSLAIDDGDEVPPGLERSRRLIVDQGRLAAGASRLRAPTGIRRSVRVPGDEGAARDLKIDVELAAVATSDSAASGIPEFERSEISVAYTSRSARRSPALSAPPAKSA